MKRWLLMLCLALASCGELSPVERAIVGTWLSQESPTVFQFFEDGTYHMSGGPEGEATGSYRSLGSPAALGNAQFVLEGRSFNLRFSHAGDSFHSYVDGMSSAQTWRRQ